MRPYLTVGPGGVANLTPPISDCVNSYLLTGGTAQKVVWPTGALWCNIVAPNPLALAIAAEPNAPATTPGSTVTNGTASALAPAQRQRDPKEQYFSLISSTNQIITIEFWGNSTTSQGG